MRATAALLAWCVATAAGLAVAWKTHVGPVVFVLTARHGVHEGDLAAFAVAYAWAALITALLFLPSSLHRLRAAEVSRRR